MARRSKERQLLVNRAHKAHLAEKVAKGRATSLNTAAMTSKTEPALRRAPLTDAELRPMANAVRALAMDAVEAAKSGHPGMPMGMADVAAVLFGEVLSFDPGDPDWPDRDRFVLSAGH